MTTRMKIPLSKEDEHRLDQNRPTDWYKGEFAATLLASSPPDIPTFVTPERRASFVFPDGYLPEAPADRTLDRSVWFGTLLHSALTFYGSAPEPNDGRFHVGTPISLPVPLVRSWALRAIRERRKIDALASEWVDRALRAIDLHLANGLSLETRTYTISVDPALFARVQSRVYALDLHFPSLLRYFLSQEHP